MKIKSFKLERYFALKFDEDAYNNFISLWLGYTESRGNPQLRKEISTLYRNINPNEILVHAGAEEAIFNFMNVALEAGDQVIVHTPYYQSLGEIAHSIGAEVIEWQGDPNDHWNLDLQFLKDHLSNKIKVVVINTPHNPTGYFPNSEFIRELSKLTDKHGFLIFSDEVYRGLEHDPSNQLPSLSDLTDNAISLGVMSKTYGLPGLRIGWIATQNKQIYALMANFKDYTTICNSAPSEFLATLALKHADKIVKRNLQIIRSNLGKLNTFFSKHDTLFKWQAPIAGPIAFPEYLAGPVGSFCNNVLSNTGVLLLPGTLYNEEYNFFRIGFGRQNMSDGLQRLDEYCSKITDKLFHRTRFTRP